MCDPKFHLCFGCREHIYFLLGHSTEQGWRSQVRHMNAAMIVSSFAYENVSQYRRDAGRLPSHAVVVGSILCRVLVARAGMTTVADMQRALPDRRALRKNDPDCVGSHGRPRLEMILPSVAPSCGRPAGSCPAFDVRSAGRHSVQAPGRVSDRAHAASAPISRAPLISRERIYSLALLL